MNQPGERPAKDMTADDTAPGQERPRCGARLRGRHGTCGLPAGWGTTHQGYGPCRKHMGNTPTVARGAERQRVEAEARKLLEGIGEYEDITDPVSELQRLAGRAVRWLDVMEAIVTDLERIRYQAGAGEQIDGRIATFEKAMDRCSAILQGLARLKLDERWVRLQEAQVALLAGVLRQALSEASLGEETRQAIIVRVAELLDEAERQPAALPAGRR